MVATPDLADVITQAAAVGAKVILAGDTQQLQAVENGGGMSLLADALGYAQLTEPGPVPRRVGTGRQPAAPRRRYHRAGRVRPARPDHRRRTRADDGRRRGRLRRADPGRHGHAADGGGPRAAPRAEPPHPRGPHHLGHRLRWPRRHHRRRHAGQLRRPDHLHPQRPQCRGRRARPGPGQRRPAPHRSHHPERPACPPGSGCSPGNRAAPVDRPTLRVQFLQGCRTGLRGHRPRRPEPHRDRRAGRDHRHRGPPARLCRAEPRYRGQPRLRVHRLAQARRPGAGPAPGP